MKVVTTSDVCQSAECDSRFCGSFNAIGHVFGGCVYSCSLVLFSVSTTYVHVHNRHMCR